MGVVERSQLGIEVNTNKLNVTFNMKVKICLKENRGCYLFIMMQTNLKVLECINTFAKRKRQKEIDRQRVVAIWGEGALIFR